ncbi:trehalose-phosphatase [Sarracenia purpurea var. burkii]
MMNQNVVVSDAKSSIGMKITVAVSNSALFSSAGPMPPVVPAGGYITISRKKLLQKLENGDGRGKKVTAWVDSMRASSPTRKPIASSETEDRIKSCWIMHHPSALGMFEQIINASKGKQIVMFLDYDGTLSPIVEDPDQAFMTHEMREAVRDVAKYFPTAIVTGRCRAKVYNFVRLSQLYYAGSHGMDIRGPANGSKNRKGNQAVLFQPAREFLPMIDEVYKALLEKTKSTPGAKVENNKFCVSVHFRCVDEKSWSALAEKVKSVLNDYPKLRLTQGRKVEYYIP